MQRAKLFGALFAYVNNIQITWKTIHLSVFCRTNSPSTDQRRAEGNYTECVGKKRFNGRVLPTGFGKSMCYVPPFCFWTRQGLKLAVAHSPFASIFQCGPLKISS